MSEHDSAKQQGSSLVSGRIFVTGGVGFVGRNIITTLRGRPLRVLVRDTMKIGDISAPTIEIVEGDVTKPETLRGAMDGCEAVIHLVGIISETGNATFDNVIRQGTVNVVKEAKRAGVKRLLHMSALGTRDDPRFGYFEAKWQAEQAVERSSIPWTIFRPSVIFGPGDGFITTLAALVMAAPVIPVAGSGRNTFQPISVGEVAEAFARALDDRSTTGHIYELGGGKIYTYDELIDVIQRQLGYSKPRIHIPVSLMKVIVRLSRPLPPALRPPVTSEQLKMLAIDNATDNSATAELIGRNPLRLEDGIDYIGDAESKSPPATVRR